MELEKIVIYLDKLLEIEKFQNSDSALNGLQVGELKSEIKKVALAVDASLATIEKAIALDCDLLLVHHGLFWGKPIALRGNHYRRVEALIKNSLALYAAHLPLDAHPQWGNNAQLAKKLELQALSPFGLYKGAFIGYQGTLPKALSLPEIIAKLGTREADCLSILPFGKKTVQSVAIVSGGATQEVYEAIEKEIDLFITGDCSHEVYHPCMEAKINMLSLGHYFTEMGGVQAVGKELKKALGVETIFIDHPTFL